MIASLIQDNDPVMAGVSNLDIVLAIHANPIRQSKA
jgi:hypothetical protein